MKAIVHIGAPKTGSSSIQTFLFRNTEALAARGVRFHRNVKARGSQFEYAIAALHSVGKLPNTEDQRMRYKARTLEEAAQTVAPHLETLRAYPSRWSEPVAVFSAEHILPWIDTPETIRALDAMFGDVFSEVRYLLYLRNPEDLLTSQYSEWTKQGHSTPMDAFIAKRIKVLNHYKHVKRWTNTLGAERIDVRLLDRGYLTGGDLIDDFCAQIGVSAEGLERPPRENEALTAPAAEALRMLNQYIPDLHPKGGRNPLRRGIVQHLMTLAEGGPRLRLLPRYKAQVNEQIAKPLEKLRAEFFPEREVLFTPRGGAEEEPGLAEVREQALDLMARLIVDIRMGTLPGLGPVEKARAVTRTPEAD